MLLEQQAEETDEEGDARGANPNASAAGCCRRGMGWLRQAGLEGVCMWRESDK